MIRTCLLVLGAFLFISNAWADLFCPNSFNSINYGDTLESVIKTCGKADSQKVTKTKPWQAQEWVYFVASYPGMTGTLKTTVAFDDKQQVVNMSVNGAGLTETQICGNKTIQFGNTPEQIKAACGKPAYINMTSSGEGAAKEIETTILRYNSTPPISLTFENGKLTKRVEGGS